MPKKTKKGNGIAAKLRGQRPSVRRRGRTSTPFKIKAIPRKSKKQLSFKKNKLSQILEPKENYNLFLVKYNLISNHLYA